MTDNAAMDSDSLLRLARIYGSTKGLRLNTVSTYMSGSGDVLARLSRGHDITTRRLRRFFQWLSDNWPADLPWPEDIPRPTPNSTPKEAA